MPLVVKCSSFATQLISGCFVLWLYCACCSPLGANLFSDAAKNEVVKFAESYDDLPYDVRDYLFIDGATKDITLTLRIWDGPLPGGLKIQLFTNQSRRLAFTMLPPMPECAMLSKLISFAYTNPEDVACRVVAEWSEQGSSYRMGLLSNRNPHMRDFVEIPREGGEVQVNIEDRKGCICSVDKKKEPRGELVCNPLAGRCLTDLDCELQLRQASEIELDAENFSHVLNFSVGTFPQDWSSDMHKKLAGCTFKFRFAGDYYRMRRRNDTDLAKPTALPPSVAAITTMDYVLPETLNWTEAQIKGTESNASSMSPDGLPRNFDAISVILGIVLILCGCASIVLLSATVKVALLYWTPFEKKAMPDQLEEPKNKDALTKVVVQKSSTTVADKKNKLP